MTTTEVDVIIIGAGVVGLSLAHALRKAGVTYQLLERDTGLDARGNGWGITIHWAKDALKQCIPIDRFLRLGTISVDYEMSQKDPGHYKFLNLATLERRYLSSADPTRIRIRREGLRKLLIPDLTIRWGSKIREIDLDHDDVGVTLTDGSCYRGKIVIGADGSNSSTRRFLCPETGLNYKLPLRFIGVVIAMSPETTSTIEKAIDPLMFQGCHPQTGVFMYYSILSTPESNGSDRSINPFFQAQVSVSWKPQSDEGAYPETSALRLKKMRELCSDMASPIREMINGIPDNSEAIEVVLQDWPCLDWPNYGGRITLAGDAAHAMTMYRGEAANFGVADAADLSEAIISTVKRDVSRAQAITEYERELRNRSKRGVMMSRQACMDAHDFHALRDDSPLLSMK